MWETRRRTFSIVNDVSSIHKTCVYFFDKLDASAVVQIHGSFARGLVTDQSDINLSIPSHTRARLENVWAASSMRKPMYEDPSVGERIEDHLRDIFGREVTICCSDDPWLWVKRDVRGNVYPSLDKQLPEVSNANISDPTARSLNVIRKCWYHVRWLEIEERRGSILWSEKRSGSSGDCAHETTSAASDYRFSQEYIVMLASNTLHGCLYSIKECQLDRLHLDPTCVAQLTQEAGSLESSIYRFKALADKSVCLNSMVEGYQRFAVAILGLESIIFQLESYGAA
jgi:hypothetical protein